MYISKARLIYRAKGTRLIAIFPTQELPFFLSRRPTQHKKSLMIFPRKSNKVNKYAPSEYAVCSGLFFGRQKSLNCATRVMYPQREKIQGEKRQCTLCTT